jgi:uncharacterized membrane protein YdjX (TVP38/TMEM64 family)
VIGAVLLGDRLSFETLRENREALVALRDANYALTALAFVLVYMAIVVLSLPGALIASLTGGFLFGLFPGVFFNMFAATAGAVLIFLAVRWGLGDGLAARFATGDARIARLKAALDDNAFWAVLTARLIPVLPFFVVNLVPALVGMRLAPFAAATVIGIVPGGLVYTSLGSGLGEVFARGETPDLGVIFRPELLLPLLGLAALSALPILVSRRRAG